MPFWFLLVSQFSLLAYAVLGGVFLAFSDFIMRALSDGEGGVESMQAINREVFRYVFMTLFIGMVPVSLWPEQLTLRCQRPVLSSPPLQFTSSGFSPRPRCSTCR